MVTVALPAYPLTRGTSWIIIAVEERSTSSVKKNQVTSRTSIGVKPVGISFDFKRRFIKVTSSSKFYKLNFVFCSRVLLFFFFSLFSFLSIMILARQVCRRLNVNTDLWIPWKDFSHSFLSTDNFFLKKQFQSLSRNIFFCFSMFLIAFLLKYYFLFI